MEKSYNFIMDTKKRTSSIESILNSVPNTGSKDFTVMYLATYLSQFFQKDPEYFLKTKEEQYGMFLSNFKLLEDRPEQFVVCKTICEKYKEYFAKFGISGEVIQIPTSSGVPMFSMLINGDENKVFFLNPLSDLYRNQFGLRMKYFGHYYWGNEDSILGYNPATQELSKEYVCGLESKIGVGAYSNEDLIMKLNEQYSNNLYDKRQNSKKISESDRISSIESKIALMNDKLINMGAFGQVNGIMERLKFYESLRSKCGIFTRQEKMGLEGIIISIEGEEVPHIQISICNDTGEKVVEYHEEYLNKKYVLTRKNK